MFGLVDARESCFFSPEGVRDEGAPDPFESDEVVYAGFYILVCGKGVWNLQTFMKDRARDS